MTARAVSHRWRLLLLLLATALPLVALPAAKVRAATPPGPVVDAFAEGTGRGVVRIAWEKPLSSGDSAITGYRVFSEPSVPSSPRFVGAEGCAPGETDPAHPLLEAEFTGLDPSVRYRFTIYAYNRSGRSSAVTTGGVYARPGVGNLVLNPSFETGLAHWAGNRSTLSRVTSTGAPDGAYVGRVAWSTGTSYAVADAPAGMLPTIPKSRAGERFVAAAAVRAATWSAVGKPAVIAIRELTPAGAVVRDTKGVVKNLTNSWQQIWVEARTAQAGNRLSVRVEQRSAGAGNAFLVDHVRMYRAGQIMGPYSDDAMTGYVPRGLDPNVKRGSAYSPGPWSPNGVVDCYAAYPHDYEIVKLRVYLDGKGGGSGSQPIRGVVYDAFTGKRLAATRTVAIAAGRAAGWVELPFAAPIAGTADGGSSFRLAVHAGGTSTIVRVHAAAAGCTGCGDAYNKDVFSDGASASFGSSVAGNYAALVVAHGGL